MIAQSAMINLSRHQIQYFNFVASGKILSFVWQWYVTNYAHTSVKDHILNVFHASFIALPWQNFWPSLPDLELMLKVIHLIFQFALYCNLYHAGCGTILTRLSRFSWAHIHVS